MCYKDVLNNSDQSVDFDCETDLNKAELPIVLLLTLIMNILSVVVLVKIRKKSLGTDYLLVISLAINDLVTTTLFIIMWLGGWVTCGCLMITSAYFCSIFGWLSSSMVVWSAWVIVIMCACRYLAFVRPIYYRTSVSTFQIQVALVSSLAFTLAQFTLPFYNVVEPYEFYNENKICGYDFAPGHGGTFHRMSILFFAVEGLLLISIVLFFNYSIIYKV